MKENKTIKECVNLFLKEELSKEELRELHSKLESNSEFADEFVGEIFRYTRRIEFNQKLERVHERVITEQNQANPIKRILLDLQSGGQNFINSIKSTQNQFEILFEQFFAVYPAPSEVRGNKDSDDLFEQAMYHYEHEDYDKALSLLKSPEIKDIHKKHFYLGMCFLAQEKLKSDKCEHHLEKVLESENLYHQHADWYLALSYLQLNKKEKALESLDAIALNESHFYREKAIELLAEIDG